MLICFNCKKELSIEKKIGLRETCPFCDADMHVCLNCKFFEETAYNECREVKAERVLDKEKMNYCDYFIFKETDPDEISTNKKQEAKKQFESLFK